MSKTIETVNLTDTTANPASLGLCGFGMTTLLFNLHNVGLFDLDTMILGMGLLFGGLTQTIVGKMEWKKNNMFGMVAFSSYGFFWMILVALLVLPQLGIGNAPTPNSMGWFLTIWAIFTLGVWIATFKHSKINRVLFGTVFLLFAFLAAADFTGSATLKMIGGIDGIICGALALYIALGEVINDSFGKQFVPLG